jgi:DNA-binding CsgD family transcriptional regulator
VTRPADAESKTDRASSESGSDLGEVPELPALDEGPDPPFGLYRLSPRETQVAILTAEGLSAEDLAAGLGIKVGTVRNIRQALRRKLDVPAQVPLNEALNGLFGTIAKDDSADRPLKGIDDGPDPAKERRVHLSVRQAISSVGELAERLDARSSAVAAAAQHTRKSRERLLWEANQLHAIARDLHELEAEAIARVRAHLALVGRVG